MQQSSKNKLTEYLTEYANKSSLKKYSDPKIFHGGSDYDLLKRWYVYYSFEHPETGKMIRQSPIYHNVNRDYKTKKERLKHLKILQSAIKDLLKSGYNPYEDDFKNDVYDAVSCLDYALKLKKKTLSVKSSKDYENRYNGFRKFLIKIGANKLPVQSLGMDTVREYLNKVLLSSSARNRNNTKMVISSLFTVMVQEGYIQNNFVLNIENLKAKPERNKTYSKKQVQELFDYMKIHDPVLLMFIQFFSYLVIRPIEACRIKVSDINLEERRVSFKAKNKPLKTKILPDILIDELKSYIGNAHDYHYLFTPTGPGIYEANEIRRREFFTDQFKIVKDHFKLDNDYTMYSFRHYFISNLFQYLRKDYGYSETLDKLQLITGHESLDGLKNYLRSIDAELPEDWSKGLA